jgi:hypothetical protein
MSIFNTAYKREFLGYICFLFLLGGVIFPARAEDNLDPLPPWNYRDLVNKATVGWGFEPEELKDVRMLAWNRELDRQNHEIENVLFWLSIRVKYPQQYNKEKTDLWVLITMTRYTQRNDGWLENARVGNHEVPGITMKEYPPRNQDIYKFLGKGWDFESNQHFRLLEGRIRRNTWMQVIGELPTILHAGEPN